MKSILFDCLLVSVGGFFGALCRFGIAGLATRVFATPFPLGTLIANISGCFLIGLLIGSGAGEKSRHLKLAFGLGFLGALTTFSTFGAETVVQAREGSTMIAASNVILNVLLGISAVVAGIWLGSQWGQKAG